MACRELPARECRRLVDISELPFKTTAEVTPIAGIASQERALTALSFGLDIRQPRFHVVVVGAPGTGRTFCSRLVANRLAKTRPTPDDILLLPNPRRPTEPSVLALSAGQGRPFVEALEELYAKLVDAIRATADGERFKQARAKAQRRVNAEESRLEEQLKATAREAGLDLVRTDNEVQITPLDEATAPPAGDALREIAATIEEFEETLATVQDEADRELRATLQQILIDAVKACFGPVRARFTDEEGPPGRANKPAHTHAAGGLARATRTTLTSALHDESAPARASRAAAPVSSSGPDSLQTDAPRSHERPAGDLAERKDIAAFLAEVEAVVCRELRLLVDEPGEDSHALPRGLIIPTLLTEHKPDSGAPVIEAPYPTLATLFGRTYAPQDSGGPPEPGFAVAGALHHANGGYLLLPAAALLKNEALYEQLKACLLAGKFIVPESNPTYFKSSAEELLIPPIELDLKVILVASPALYQDLHEADPEFSQLFKVQARFETTLPIDEARTTYPAFIADLARARRLPPFTADAVAELLFYGGKLAESQSKVTAQLGLIAEVATEAGYSAERRGHAAVDGAEVVAALAAARRRGSHFRDHVHELLADGTIRIEVTGSRVGQVNAISVLTDGPQVFGRPCRVTAVVFPGIEGPVNIAREVEMSGPLHSKGVLILTGFLAARFAQFRPLSFSASLVFEQTYEPIEGDSASSTELFALLSALSGFALRQDIAVTGSVDQSGSIQPVGGANEKIEAFFDLCAAKGLTGAQGVLVPKGNRDSVMLRSDVIEAIEAGRFHVFEAETVEDGIELLTGVPAGIADAYGHYPEGTVYGAVEARLKRFHQAMAEFNRGR